jgi:hypothetical protein
MDEWEVIAEYATNHQQAMDSHEIVVTFTDTPKFLCMKAAR